MTFFFCEREKRFARRSNTHVNVRAIKQTKKKAATLDVATAMAAVVSTFVSNSR